MLSPNPYWDSIFWYISIWIGFRDGHEVFQDNLWTWHPGIVHPLRFSWPANPFTSLGEPPGLSSIASCSVWSCFPCLLWQPTALWLHVENLCPTSSSEWSAAGGCGEGKSELSPVLGSWWWRTTQAVRWSLRMGQLAGGGEHSTCGLWSALYPSPVKFDPWAIWCK